MNYSKLNEIATSRDAIETFGGYNHNIRINDGEFYDMKNLTSSFYPVLSPRVKRGTYEYPSSASPVTHSPNGLISKDSLCYVDGTKFYINNYEVSGLTLTNSPKQLVSMGAYVIILPDKKYINTANQSDYGNIEAMFPSSAGTSVSVTYTMCDISGTAYSITYTSASEPSNANNGDYWIDTSTTPHTLKQYSSASSMWTQVATTYVKIAAANIASGFSEGDGVTLNGISVTQLADLNGQTSLLYGAYHDSNNGANDYIIVVGILDAATTKTETLSVKRLMPDLDFVIESENRLWGCKYGLVNGSVVNEIYACKQGDFRNWNVFAGISTDSYVASCGTDGQWTGAITHLGYPIFFKENCLHKVYGNYPANYQIQTTACRGVMKGAGRSLAIVNEVLYYKSRNGVCAYDGSLPSEVSSAFGEIHYTGVDDNITDKLRNGAVGGSHGNKYYISMMSEEDNQWYLFVLDAQKGLWHKEDNTRADAFCSCRGEMYYIDHSTAKIKTILGSGTQDTSATEWMAETGVVTDPNVKNGSKMSIDNKYISRLVMRMSLAVGSRVMFYIQYDSCGEWEHLCSLTGTSLRSFSIPIRPKRCDHFRLRIVGVGEAKIFSVSRTFEQGSDT